MRRMRIVCTAFRCFGGSGRFRKSESRRRSEGRSARFAFGWGRLLAFSNFLRCIVCSTPLFPCSYERIPDRAVLMFRTDSMLFNFGTLGPAICLNNRHPKRRTDGVLSSRRAFRSMETGMQSAPHLPLGSASAAPFGSSLVRQLSESAKTMRVSGVGDFGPWPLAYRSWSNSQCTSTHRESCRITVIRRHSRSFFFKCNSANVRV